MEHSDWLQRCLVRKLGAASDFLGANILFLILDVLVNCKVNLKLGCWFLNVEDAGK
jgi:hypothetical protein